MVNLERCECPCHTDRRPQADQQRHTRSWRRRTEKRGDAGRYAETCEAHRTDGSHTAQRDLAECACDKSPIAALFDSGLVGPALERELQSRRQRSQHGDGGGCQLRDKQIAVVPMLGMGALMGEHDIPLIVVEQLDESA